MPIRRALASTVLSILPLGGLIGCEDHPGAAVNLTDARISRDDQRNVVVDVDLAAQEALGGGVGVYCVRVVFLDPSDIRDECKTDLEDGDTRTARFVAGDLPAGHVVKVRVRLQAMDSRRDLVVPPAR